MAPAHRTRDEFDINTDRSDDSKGEHGREQGALARTARRQNEPTNPTRPAAENPSATRTVYLGRDDDELEEARAKLNRLTELAELMEKQIQLQERIAKITAAARMPAMPTHSIPMQTSQENSTLSNTDNEGVPKTYSGFTHFVDNPRDVYRKAAEQWFSHT